MGKNNPQTEIAAALGSIFTLLVFGYIFWVLFSQQIIAWFTNLVSSLFSWLLTLTIGVVSVSAGWVVGKYLEENGSISAGWGTVLATVIFIVISNMQFGILNGIAILVDLGFAAVFVFKYIEERQYS